MTSKVLRVVAVLIVLIGLSSFASFAQNQPLSKDDIQLLLLGGASTEKMVSLINQRGIDFQMDPNLAKRFHDAGASDAVIVALQKASERARGARGGAASVPSATAPAPTAAAASPPATRPAPLPTGGSPKAESGPATAGLPDPSSDEVQRIIQAFGAKEKVFREARNNYTYHQVNKVQELDPDGNVEGVYEQDWDILYDDNGHRIERVTYAPTDTLKGLIVTKEDLEAMRNIQPFVLTTDDLPDYDVKYLGHSRVDEITAYVFSVRPKEMKKGRLYFRGVVWVDDRDLQIVKSEGQNVGEISPHKGQLNLFPRFTTYREQIDGKFWFPTYTMADDTLYFPGMPVRVREIIKYNEYKQYKASSKIQMIGEASPGEQKGKAQSTNGERKPKP